jgi:hypothetical protein
MANCGSCTPVVCCRARLVSEQILWDWRLLALALTSV